MSLNIGDNFKYYGKMFLDDRQSFETLEELLACTDVPEGFISYCKENQTRYEFKDNSWIEYKESTSTEELDLFAEKIKADIKENFLDNKKFKYLTQEQYYNLSDEQREDETIVYNIIDADDVIITDEDIRAAVIHEGDTEPDEDEKIWFDSNSGSSSSGLTENNPIILELFACIKSLQDKVIRLEEEVEYLKINGGGGSGSGPLDPPDIPDDEEKEDEYGESVLALEDGSLFLFEDGGFVLLEESVANPLTDSILILEDGSRFLTEEGTYFVLENNARLL